MPVAEWIGRRILIAAAEVPAMRQGPRRGQQQSPPAGVLSVAVPWPHRHHQGGGGPYAERPPNLQGERAERAPRGPTSEL